jgi:hypothetical protein
VIHKLLNLLLQKVITYTTKVQYLILILPRNNGPLRKITPLFVLPKNSDATPEKTNKKIGKIVVENKYKPRTSDSSKKYTKIDLTSNSEKIVEKKYGHAINNIDYNV